MQESLHKILQFSSKTNILGLADNEYIGYNE